MRWLPSADSRQVFLERFGFQMAYFLSQMFGVWNGTGVTNFLLRKGRINTLQARLSPVRFFPILQEDVPNKFWQNQTVVRFARFCCQIVIYVLSSLLSPISPELIQCMNFHALLSAAVKE